MPNAEHGVITWQSLCESCSSDVEYGALHNAVTNQFPELDDATPENVIIGGVNDYVFNTRNSPKIITKATYSTGLSFQANEIKGTFLTYIPLKTFIRIESIQQETFLIAFSNTPYGASGQTRTNIFPMYATFGKSSFQNAIIKELHCALGNVMQSML